MTLIIWQYRCENLRTSNTISTALTTRVPFIRKIWGQRWGTRRRCSFWPYVTTSGTCQTKIGNESYLLILLNTGGEKDTRNVARTYKLSVVTQWYTVKQILKASWKRLMCFPFMAYLIKLICKQHRCIMEAQSVEHSMNCKYQLKEYQQSLVVV